MKYKCIPEELRKKSKDISDRKGMYKGMKLIKGKFHWANSKWFSVAGAESTREINQETKMDEFICYESFCCAHQPSLYPMGCYTRFLPTGVMQVI